MNDTDKNKIEELLKVFGIAPHQIQTAQDDDLLTITIDMPEEEAGRLIGRFASTLDSLQLIISLMLNQGESHKHVLLDVAGYRQRRSETLSSMVENAKNQVHQTQAPCMLPPLSSIERRQVHLMIQNDEQFTSYSDGHGQDRRLFISLKTV